MERCLIPVSNREDGSGIGGTDFENIVIVEETAY